MHTVGCADQHMQAPFAENYALLDNQPYEEHHILMKNSMGKNKRNILWLTGAILVSLALIIVVTSYTYSRPPYEVFPIVIDRLEMQLLKMQLEIPAKAQVGESIPLKLKVKNTGWYPVELTLGGRPPYNFIVSNEHGSEIWSWTSENPMLLIIDVKTFPPREELEFATEWQQVDSWGNTIPPGTYLVKGVLNLEPPEILETESRQLIITSR